MKFLKRRLEESLNMLKAYQAATNVAAIVSITDLKGEIIYVNDKFQEISGYTSEELIGKTHRIINSGYHDRGFFREMWATISTGKPWRGEIKNKAKNGSFYWVDTIITPVFDSAKRVIQYLSIRNLITDKKENEERLLVYQQQLLKRKQQLKDAQEIAITGSWYIKLPDGAVEWSDEACHIFGIPAKSTLTYDQFLEKVHPDDRSIVHEKWQTALKGHYFDIEHRIIIEQKIIWIRAKARPEFNGNTSLVAAIGTLQDITDRKNIEISLVESELLYRDLFDNIPVPVGIVDKHTYKFLQVNKAAQVLYGYGQQEFHGLTLFDIRVEEEHEQLQARLEDSSFPSENGIRTHRKKNGELLQIEPVIKDIIYKRQSAYLISIIDMTEKLKLSKELGQARLKRQKELNRVSMEAQEQYRSEIGRELHDNVNQLLVASLIFLKATHVQTPKDAETKEKTTEIISKAIEEIRKLSQSLIPPSLNELSLIESLQGLSYNLLLLNMPVDFDFSLQEEQLDDGFKVNIYRIIQEQFNNIIKYSAATNVKVSIQQTTDTLTLEITDNGKGFDVKTRPRGIGLKNITYRAETYNGTTVIESSPGNGCRVCITFSLVKNG